MQIVSTKVYRCHLYNSIAVYHNTIGIYFFSFYLHFSINHLLKFSKMNTENNLEKGLMVSIYRDTYDSIINKLHGKKHAILLVEDCKVFKPNDEMPAIKIVKRFIGGRNYFHAEPTEIGSYAFGGSFVYTSDSRFPLDYPLPLHDRNMNLEAGNYND